MIITLIFIAIFFAAVTAFLYSKRKDKRTYYTLFVLGIIVIIVLVITIGFFLLLDYNGEFPKYILP